ncbi:MAG: hypothetical protein HND48_13605 [Chloroflexi bacterium]|nr:hypothetical protein [Chloroflexota bacterium]
MSRRILSRKSRSQSADEHWQARVLQDGLPADRALAIMLATDGVWATELLGLQALDGDRRSSIRDYLFTLIDHA